MVVDNKVIYFDPDVKDISNKWIGGIWICLDNARKVAEYFEKIKFKLKNSSELGQWMKQAISSQECGETIVIFAQDVAPYDVFDDDTAHALIRQYLDNGGTILWIGDIPFIYRTKWEKNSFLREVVASGSFQILGVIPVNMVIASKFSIAKEGYTYGLKTKWASLRPIIFPSQLETDRTRISDFFMRRKGFIELAHVEGTGIPRIRPFQRKGHLQRLLEFFGTSSLKAGPLELIKEKEDGTLKTDSQGNPALEFEIKYLSAWVKIFDRDIKESGFIRVWDYAPRIITNKMLEEISVLLNRYCKKKMQ